MPQNQVTDLITDLEMVFSRLILSGTMTDRQAAQTAGLNPDTAAYTKAKPRVRDYMLEHRAAVQEQFLQQEAEGLRRQIITREQVLGRLWEIAKLSPEITRNSVTGQTKALAMIVAIEGLIPDRRAARKESAPPLTEANIDRSNWFPKQPGETTASEPSLDATRDEDARPVPDPAPDAPSIPAPAPSPALDYSEFVLPQPVNPWEKTSTAPRITVFSSAPDYFPPLYVPTKASAGAASRSKVQKTLNFIEFYKTRAQRAVPATSTTGR